MFNIDRFINLLPADIDRPLLLGMRQYYSHHSHQKYRDSPVRH